MLSSFINLFKKNNQKFTSSFGYTINLPENWAEYEDEENTNAFFDTTNWTGNLRISILNTNKEITKNHLLNEEANENKEVILFKTKNGYDGKKYFEESTEDFIYYWILILENKLAICSFTIDLKNKNTPENKNEFIKVDRIINSIELK